MHCVAEDPSRGSRLLSANQGQNRRMTSIVRNLRRGPRSCPGWTSSLDEGGGLRSAELHTAPRRSPQRLEPISRRAPRHPSRSTSRGSRADVMTGTGGASTIPDVECVRAAATLARPAPTRSEDAGAGQPLIVETLRPRLAGTANPRACLSGCAPVGRRQVVLSPAVMP